VGRPRNPALDDAIVAAALRSVAGRGLAETSFGVVAKRARVGRPAIYRRFRNKKALAIACLQSLSVTTDEMTGATTVSAFLASAETLFLSTDLLGWLGDCLAQRDGTLLVEFRATVVTRLLEKASDVVSDTRAAEDLLGGVLLRAIMSKPTAGPRVGR
jgi:AcrR family transcriptional regulator